MQRMYLARGVRPQHIQRGEPPEKCLLVTSDSLYRFEFRRNRQLNYGLGYIARNTKKSKALESHTETDFSILRDLKADICRFTF